MKNFNRSMIDEKYNNLIESIYRFLNSLDSGKDQNQNVMCNTLSEIYYLVTGFYHVYLETPLPSIKTSAGLSLQDCAEDYSQLLKDPKSVSIAKQLMHTLSYQIEKDVKCKLEQIALTNITHDQPAYDHLLREIQQLKEGVAELKAKSTQPSEQHNRIGLFK